MLFLNVFPTIYLIFLLNIIEYTSLKIPDSEQILRKIVLDELFTKPNHLWIFLKQNINFILYFYKRNFFRDALADLTF